MQVSTVPVTVLGAVLVTVIGVGVSGFTRIALRSQHTPAHFKEPYTWSRRLPAYD
jgi:hypothetical protein